MNACKQLCHNQNLTTQYRVINNWGRWGEIKRMNFEKAKLHTRTCEDQKDKLSQEKTIRNENMTNEMDCSQVGMIKNENIISEMNFAQIYF